jgi:hypothetical protein
LRRGSGCLLSGGVTTGAGGPEMVQVITLTPLEEGTLLTQVHTYPDRDASDQALDSGMVEGMVEGMEPTYTRLEALPACRPHDRSAGRCVANTPVSSEATRS